MVFDVICLTVDPVIMDGTNSNNMLHYGFSSLDEEIAKDQMDPDNV